MISALSIAALLSRMWSVGSSVLTTAGNVTTAVATVLAAALQALPGILRAVAGSPLLAAVTAGAIMFAVGGYQGWDARANHDRKAVVRAIDRANHRADIAIAAIRAEAEKSPVPCVAAVKPAAKRRK